MNRCAVVLFACLAWPMPFALGQNALKNSALQISVRFDDETQVNQRIRTVEGGRAAVLVGPSRPLQKRQYIPTPVGPIPQEVTVTQEQTPAFEVVPRVLGDSVHVQTAGSAVSGRLGEWLKLGAVAAAGGTRTVWIRVDEVP